MKRFLVVALFNGSTALADLPVLRFTEDRPHIATAEGGPFFYLGETAWELFHRLTREEADAYLAKRAQQGFTVIHAVALAEHDFSTPDAYGDPALDGFDPVKPNEACFRHVDYFVTKAESLGLYTGFLPTWGDKWNMQSGKGPEIFTPENARIFGEWLGRRYKEKPIIWILGGDRAVESEQHRAVIRALAAGLKAGDGGRNLVSFHPKGRTNSSDFWPDEPWLDFHQFQSGHRTQDNHTFDYNAKNLALKVFKPTMDGEPCYEDHPVRGLAKEGVVPGVWFDDYDVRRAAWWSMLSGACGHVYGNHSVWQFFDGKREPHFFARTPWRKAIEYPGAMQMGYMRAFLEKLDWQKLVRDDAFLIGRWAEPLKPDQQPMAAVARDGGFAVVYLPDARAGSAAPDFTRLSFKFGESEAVGFDPGTGSSFVPRCSTDEIPSYRAILERGANGGKSEARHRDWVLLLKKKQN